MKNNSLLPLTVSGLLIAIGIVIPAFSPVKIVLEPASFTLASHVAIFIAMFISPGVAVAVVIGTTAGFFIGGFPLIIVFRAASHIVFAAIGALYIQRAPQAVNSAVVLRLFSFCAAVIHAVCEVIVVSVFYFSGSILTVYYQQGFFTSVLLLVGVGTVVHSLIDFEIAHIIKRALQKQVNWEVFSNRE